MKAPTTASSRIGTQAGVSLAAGVAGVELAGAGVAGVELAGAGVAGLIPAGVGGP
jgi:hypothetical protein